MKNLRFYNKEGYPYNFQYNDTNQQWEGKLLFDQNSSDLYKTIGIYLFENVDPIEFSEYFDFKKFELFNYSGITLIGETKQDVAIESVSKTNSSSDFSTKWIGGKNFHQLFPAGTMIKFKNMVGNPDLTLNLRTDVYFNVIAVKSDAIMVQTVTTNDAFNGMFTSGTISTYNIIKYPDYGNNYYSMMNANLHLDKKLSIVNSTKNDGVKNLIEYYTGITHQLYRSIYDYNLSGSVGDYMNLELDIYTDRPLLYSGSFTVSGTTFRFDTPFKNSIKVGQNLIFEDYNRNKLLAGNTYDVLSLVTEKLVTTNRIDFYVVDDITVSNEILYYAKVTGDLTQLKVEDIIYFSGSTSSLNYEKDFKVINTSYESGYTTLQLEQHVHTESDLTYEVYNRLKVYEYDTIITSGISQPLTNLSGITYSTTNKLNFRQEIIASGSTTYDSTINAFVYNFNADLNANGVNAYCITKTGSTISQLVIEGLYEYNYKSYFNPILTIQDYDGVIISTISSNCTYTGYTTDIAETGSTSVHYLVTSDRLYNEKVFLSETTKLANTYHEEIKFNLSPDTQDFGFMLLINSTEYYIPFQNFSGSTTCTHETINDFILKYGTALYNTGVNVSTGATIGSLYMDTLYPNVRIIDLSVKVNVFSSYIIVRKEYNDTIPNPIIISGNELEVMGSTDLFKIGLSTGMIISVTGNTYNENQKEYNILGLTSTNIQLSYQGAFFDDNGGGVGVVTTINSREYIRKPRESYNKDIYYRVSWGDTQDNPYDDSMFFYDISGDQLKPPVDVVGNYITSLTYIGQKPLFDARQQNVVRLNSEPNKKLSYVSNPKYQQTVFDTLEFALPQLDSNSEFNYLPLPFEIFLGYNSPNEGVNTNAMYIDKIEYLTLSGTTGVVDNYFIFSTDGTIEYKSNTFIGFNNFGFEVGQLIKLKFKDANPIEQIVFENYETYEIINVYRNKIVIDTTKTSKTFKSFISNENSRTFNFNIEVMPKRIATFSVYGESEIEDERFSTNLKNMGININAEEERIFKESDLDEYGVDYTLLNNKRKEMLIMYPEIYNYIGSYKSMIGAINYFGYSDLEVYEYYKNINSNSPLYKKYFRVHIPDMFDLSTAGWTEYDFIKSKGNRNNYQKTSLFNLTYNITDVDGNNLNLYSLQEVQVKLQKLKIWLRENVLPLSSNILDITGAAKVPTTVYTVHDSSNSVVKLCSTSDCSVVNFNYISTLSFSTNYLFTINFYTVSGDVPKNFELIVKTFNKDATGKLIPVQYFKLLKTDLESFNFGVDKLIDPYVYVETSCFNDYGVGVKNNVLFKFDEAKTYYLINNNFRYKYYPRISTEKGYYIIDDDGQLWIVETY